MTDQKQVLDILRKMAAKMEEQKEYLTELDRPIGDNDHGINMARGFAEVEKELPALEGKDIGGILQKTGMILLSKVGGSAGPLYGSAFMKGRYGIGRKDGGFSGGFPEGHGHCGGGHNAQGQVHGRGEDHAGRYDSRPGRHEGCL